MSIHSRLFAAALVAGAACLLVLLRSNAQQPTTAPARRAGAANTNRTPVLVPRAVADGGGYRTEYREEQHVVLTPELQQLHAAEIEAAKEAQAHVSALAKASESDREALKTAIRDALVRQFDAQQKRRSEEIANIEERLGKLKETLQKRGAAKEAIVSKRLDQLMGIKDDLAWEETRAVPQPVYSIPGLRTPTIPAYPYTVPPAGSVGSPPGWAPGSLNLTPPGVPSTPVPTIAPQPAWPAAPSAQPVPAPPSAAPATPAPPAPAAAPTAPVPPSAPAPAADPAAPR